jgi:hypothetical protein
MNWASSGTASPMSALCLSLGHFLAATRTLREYGDHHGLRLGLFQYGELHLGQFFGSVFMLRRNHS